MDRSLSADDGGLPRAVVVIHEATRTGAPIVGLRILEAMEGRFDRICILRRGGALATAFADRSEHLVTEPFAHTHDLLERMRRRRYAFGVRTLERLLASRILAAVSPDLVYANSVVCHAYADASIRKGIPTVLHSHELGVVAAPYLLHPWTRRPGGRFAAVATSDTARHDMAFLLGVLPDEVDVLHPPVPLRSLPSGPAGRSLLVGAVGLVDPWKGPDLFLEVAEEVLSRNSGIAFRWVGGGTELESIREQLTRRGLEDRVAFRGPSDDVASEYDRMALFVLTSRLESLSIVVLEAMSRALPVIAFDVGGVREAVGDAGILVPPGDIGAMATAVLRLANDPIARAELGQAGLERVRDRFGLEVFRARLDEILERTLAGAL